MKRNSIIFLILSVLSAALLSLPWLIPNTGIVALIAFVPLLFADAMARELRIKSFWVYVLLCFFLWNSATTFWVCEATVGGGIFAIVANSVQMLLVWLLYRLSAKLFKSGVLPYIFFAALWIAWERKYFSAEISWPWLTLGNAFADSTQMVQWYEYTGIMGGSLWVWLTNLGIFALISTFCNSTWKKWTVVARLSLCLAVAFVIVGPIILSGILYKNYGQRSEQTMEVIVAQPNFDPYEKFESMSQKQQNKVLADLFDSALAERTRAVAESLTEESEFASVAQGISSLDSIEVNAAANIVETRSPELPILLLGPETFTSDVFVNNPGASATLKYLKDKISDSNANLLLGASTYEYVHSNSKPHILARNYGKATWLLSYNSAIMLSNDGTTDLHHKGKLVVGTEKTPYPKIFVPIDDWLSSKMGLSGLMGRCIEPKEPTLFNIGEGYKIACAICYESVYAEYCSELVKKGANLLTVITNDAWWGDTPGYRQHLNYSRLRAIETRRDVARCANTGISCFIDQRGDIIAQTPWWQRTTLSGKVNLNSFETVFVKYGDIVGRVCSFVVLLLAALIVVRLLIGKRS